MSMLRLFEIEEYVRGVSPAESVQLNGPTLGVIAERIVDARCMERGLATAPVSADTRGVDLMVNGYRVQVKSTRKPQVTGRGGTYYRFSSGRRWPSGKSPPIATLALRCDVFALYAHDTAQLWLLTSEYVRDKWPRGSFIYVAIGEHVGLGDFAVFERPA